MSNPKYDYLKIAGNLLGNKYGVYIVQIDCNGSSYFYVGQTGDAKYISARSSFYRLAAHLAYGKSTQNQVYEALRGKVGTDTSREEMENWLNDASIEMFFFPTDDFVYLEESRENKDMHHGKIRKTLALETALIKIGKDRGLEILNTNEVTYKKYQASLSKADEIWQIVMQTK